MQYRRRYTSTQRRRRVPLYAWAIVAILPALVVTGVILLTRPDVASSGGSVAASDASNTFVPASIEATLTPEETPRQQALSTAGPEENLAPPPTSHGVAPPEISAAAAIVVDSASLEVLYDKNGRARRPPASLTKIATAIVAVERGQLDEVVESEIHYWDLDDSSTMGLEPGDVFTVRELLYGLLLVSGNDAANMIGRQVSGSEAAFVDEMNAMVERLGLRDTRFTNPSGLHNDRHYSTAWDLVLLSRYLMRFPDLRTIVGTETHVALGKREGEPLGIDLYNHNPLLNYTPGVDGVKTGFHEQAGRTFSVTVERDGHRIYIVLLDTPLRADDSQALIEWAYENHTWPDELPTTGSTATSTPLTP